MMIFFNHKVPKKSIRYLIIISFLLASTYLHGQGEKKFIRQGNREYGKGKFPESETSYRRAIDKNKVSPDAVFNAGDALYKQKKYEEAGKQFIENSTMNEDKSKKASAMYNLGNSLLKSGKLQESIEAYKNSLKLNPQNMEAKYNLAYAQDLLKQQQDKQKQNQDKKDQNKDNKKDQNKDNKKDQNDKQNDRQKQQDQKDQQQQQQQQQTISKDDAERLLNSIANDEKNVQEKVKLAKAMNSKVRTVKNW
jgi:tetratricopeptide (TPR) repeat protein